jgi:hypothetical protein
LRRDNLLFFLTYFSIFHPTLRVSHEDVGTDLILEATDKAFSEKIIRHSLCVESQSLKSSLLEAGQIRKKGYFGKKGMHEESDSWKEEQHVCMHGRPNDVRVRVFVIHCNG